MGAGASLQLPTEQIPQPLDTQEISPSPLRPPQARPASASAYVKTLPLAGLRLSFAEEFIALCGGREALQGLSTKEVVERHILPQTAAEQQSYVAMLRGRRHAAVCERAQAMVIHCWQEPFLAQIDALVACLAQQRDGEVSVWWDVFCLDQHALLRSEDCDLGDAFFAKTLPQSVRGFERAVLVCTQWDLSTAGSVPRALQRTWCLFECFCTLHQFTISTHKSTANKPSTQLMVAFSPSLQQTLLSRFYEHKMSLFDALFSAAELGKDWLDFDRSACWREEDRRRIVDKIQTTTGSALLQSKVSDRFRQAVLRWIAQRVTEECADGNNTQNIALSTIERQKEHRLLMIDLHNSLQDIETALRLSREHLLALESELGASHPQTLRAMLRCAELYRKQSNLTEAEFTASECIHRCESDLSQKNMQAVYISALRLVGELHVFAQRYQEGEDCFAKSLAACAKDKTFEKDRSAVLLSLANTHALQRAWKSSEQCFRDGLTVCVELFGERHAESFEAMRGLTLSLLERSYAERESDPSGAQSLREEAMALITRCRAISSSLWGENHARTLSLLTTLADLFRAQQSFSDAEKLYAECLQRKTRSLSVHHPSTLAAWLSLGEFYLERERFAEAEELLKSCFTLTRKSLSLSHPFTLSCGEALLRAHMKRDHLDEVMSLGDLLVQSYSRLLGDAHSTTLSLRYSVGEWLYVRARYALASPYFFAVYEHARAAGREKDRDKACAHCALCCERLGERERALLLWRQFAESLSQSLGAEHSKTAAVLQHISALEEQQR